MIALLASLAIAGELSLSGRVVAINRDKVDGGYFVKFQGMSLNLKTHPGSIYQCVRLGLNTQDILVFSFDPNNGKLTSCEKREAFGALEASFQNK